MGKAAWFGLLALLYLGGVTPSSGAQSFGALTLTGLSEVRVDVVAGAGMDVETAQVVAEERLQKAGIAVRPEALSALQVSLNAGQGLLTADLTLLQPICLEREPMVSAVIPTWVLARAVRLGQTGGADSEATSSLETLLHEFVREWEVANRLR